MVAGRPKAPLVLAQEECLQVKSIASSRSLPHGLVQRARLVLMAGAGRQAPAARTPRRHALEDPLHRPGDTSFDHDRPPHLASLWPAAPPATAFQALHRPLFR